MAKRERLAKVGTALFFLALLWIGLFTLRDYAAGYDELVVMNTFRSNLKEYALVGEKLGLHWQYALSLSVPRIADDACSTLGLSTLYPLAPFLQVMDASQYWCSTLFSLAVWLWFMAGVWALYALARNLGLPRLLACLATLLLYVSPRFFADAHINERDIGELSLFLISLWLGFRFLNKMTFFRAVTFSLAGAVATNLRIVGVLPWSFVCLCAVILVIVRQQWSFRMFAIAASTVASYFAFYFLLTPASWSQPIQWFLGMFGSTAAFQNWRGIVYFRGAEFHLPEHSLPFYYLPYMLLVSLPLYTLPLAAVGQISAICKCCKRPGAFLQSPRGLLLLAATGCWAVTIAAFALVRPLVYNGWRHCYFACAGLLVLATYGINVLWQKCQKRAWIRRIYVFALCGCFVVSGIGMILNHPYESSYYNVLCSKATMETDYWNAGGSGALKRLASCEERNQALPLEVGCYFFDLQNARFKLDEELRNRLTTTTAKDAPYLYYIENYVQVYMVPPPDGYHQLFKTYSYGRLIGTMYEKDME